MASLELQNVGKVFTEADVMRWMARNPPKGSDGNPLPAHERSSYVKVVRALEDCNLYVPDGTTMAIVGPSGCGKSTLLRAVAGLEETTGIIRYGDRDMTGIPPKERRIGMVFQSYALYPHFFGQGNLKFYFKVRKTPDTEAEERIRITADMMGYGFDELLKRKPGTLSGGQQQRLAIARALVRQPELFLFDEPLSNLDAKLRSRTRTEIKRLLHRFNITAVYVTHDQTEAIALGDSIAVMREGRIEQVGTFHELINKPTNAFVAGFVGHPPMNLLPATVHDGALLLGGPDTATRITVPESILNVLHNGQSITLGIRPDAAQVISGAVDALEGKIEVVEPDFGRSQQIAYLRTGDMTYSVIAPLDIHMEVGYPARVRFPAEALYLFDGESGDRIAIPTR